jgi:N utilization substance protein B
MALPPQKFREIVFQLLYSSDMGFSEEKDIIALLMQELAVARKYVLAAQEKVKEIRKHQPELDDAIGKAAVSYEFERIQTVERNILRLGAYELLFDCTIPSVVAIAEAVRLAKKFGTPESASFVNAVLDAIYKLSKGENVDTSAIQERIEHLKQSEQTATEKQNESKE